MKYMLLIHDDEKAWARLNEAERGKIYAEYGQFGQSVKASGNYLAGAQLQPTTMATSVRLRDGKRLVTDGPFAETREQLGGYYLVEAKDLDEAIGIAARIPSAKIGTIEVRRSSRWGSRRPPRRSRRMTAHARGDRRRAGHRQEHARPTAR
jgi:hypothetical protein